MENMLNKTLMSIMLTILLIGIVSATPTLIRTTPTSVNPGQTFTVTYTATDTEKYFVAWSESITGGCTPTTYNDFMASETSGTKSITATFTAPSSGSCTFNGYYQFAGGGKINYPEKVVSVSGITGCTVGDTRDCTTIEGDEGTQTCNSERVWGSCKKSSNTWIYIVVGIAGVLLLLVLMGGKRR